MAMRGKMLWNIVKSTWSKWKISARLTSPHHCVLANHQEFVSNKKRLVLLYYDESIYNCNEGQTWMWGEEDKPGILPKTKGSGVMIYSRLHWRIRRLLASLRRGVQKGPSQRTLGFFWSMEHNVMGILLATGFLRRWRMHVTLLKWNIHPQRIRLSSFSTKAAVTRSLRSMHWSQKIFSSKMEIPGEWEIPRGLELPSSWLILMEQEDRKRNQSNDTKGRQQFCPFYDDFRLEKTRVEHYVEGRGFNCLFLPKFHCELNPLRGCGANQRCTVEPTLTSRFKDWKRLSLLP